MRRTDALALLLVLALGAASAFSATRVATHYQAGGDFRAELGARRTTLAPETRARLQALNQRVSATYYVSGREHMPSHMRRVERQVTDLLEAMRSAAPERFDYQIVDPEEQPDLAGFAANRRIAPFRQRSVTRDSYSERTVWSALALSYGTRPEAVIDGITPETLPRLQRAIVAHLDRMEAPRAPVFALAGSPADGARYEELAAALAERGRLVRASLDEGEPFPLDADVLFWMAPRRVSSQRLAELDRFLAAGKSVVIAGATKAVDGGLRAGPDGPVLTLRDSGFAAGALWPHLGLRPLEGLFCDERADEVLLDGEPHVAPFAIRCIAPNQSFRRWGRQPNGTLLFALPTPLALDGSKLSQRGVEAHVLATTSDATWRQAAPPGGALPLASMTPEVGTSVPKQALIVELVPDDPWQGRVVALAATTPFEDGIFTRAFNAHRPLLDTLVAELASDQRLIIADAPADTPAPLPALAGGARLFWRFATVFLLPLALVCLFFVLREREPRAPATRTTGSRHSRGPALAVGVAVVLLGGAAWLRHTSWRTDVSAEQASVLAKETRALAARAGERGTLEAILAFSARPKLPPGWRTNLDRLERLLGDLERAGAQLRLERVDPSALDAEAALELASRGVQPLEVVSREEEVTTVRTLFATLLLRSGEREEHVSFTDERSFEDLEFRLAFALWRLETGRTPHVAFASDVPRLSAAEAHEDYQQKGLFAPSGVDVYSRARARLARAGYRVTHVNPREPVLPEDADVLVWMQPRRSVERMLHAASRYLHGGGRVLLAAQHFNIQSRQYRGADFELVYWPQPQSPDVERFWFPELGIDLVREVLFDEVATAIETDTQITGRGPERDFERQTSTLPFLVRAVAANFDADSPVTRALGDQSFAWPSFLRFDEERLDALGLTALPLISTSPRTWSLDWKGGWIPPELLAGPPRDDAGEAQWLGRVPLAALVTGTFPRPEGSLRLDGGSDPELDALPWPESAPGRLLFLGASEPFKDGAFDDAVFRSDHLLLNAVATLALEPGLADVAVRRRVARGFDWVAPEARLAWRAGVVGAGPLALLVVAAIWGLARRRGAPLPLRHSEVEANG